MARREMRRVITRIGAGLLLCASMGGVQAQSHATLYGRVVAGVDYQNNIADAQGRGGRSHWGSASNQWGTSMFGFTGVEDLGGGLSAFYTLETGFEASKGTANGAAVGADMLNRRAFVGIRDHWGRLAMGMNRSLSNDIWSIDPTGQQFMGTAALVHGRNWKGVDNALEYTTPKWGGFSATFQMGLGNQADGFKKLKKDAISLAYTHPSFELRAIYDVARDENGRYTDLWLTSKELTLGGTVTFEQLKLYAGYQRLSAPDALKTAPSKARHTWVGMNYELTPLLTLIGSAFHISTDRAGSATLYMLGANCKLSKRRLLYASVGRVRNSATADFAVEATSTNNPPLGGRQTGMYYGISHTF